jgi:predicted RNA-binding protein YlqC (UPF0109 family)
VHTEQSDVGKIIGKAGSTVKMLRTLLGCIVSREGKHVGIEVVDPSRYPPVRRPIG